MATNYKNFTKFIKCLKKRRTGYADLKRLYDAVDQRDIDLNMTSILCYIYDEVVSLIFSRIVYVDEWTFSQAIRYIEIDTIRLIPEQILYARLTLNHLIRFGDHKYPVMISLVDEYNKLSQSDMQLLFDKYICKDNCELILSFPGVSYKNVTPRWFANICLCGYAKQVIDKGVKIANKLVYIELLNISKNFTSKLKFAETIEFLADIIPLPDIEWIYSGSKSIEYNVDKDAYWILVAAKRCQIANEAMKFSPYPKEITSIINEYLLELLNTDNPELLSL